MKDYCAVVFSSIEDAVSADEEEAGGNATGSMRTVRVEVDVRPVLSVAT
jgi:hypothetical protein